MVLNPISYISFCCCFLSFLACVSFRFPKQMLANYPRKTFHSTKWKKKNEQFTEGTSNMERVEKKTAVVMWMAKTGWFFFGSFPRHGFKSLIEIERMLKRFALTTKRAKFSFISFSVSFKCMKNSFYCICFSLVGCTFLHICERLPQTCRSFRLASHIFFLSTFSRNSTVH